MKFLVLTLFVVLLFACNRAEKTIPIKDRFDAIENIVGTANWQLVDGPDTSYIYFSRIGDARLNVYNFKIDKGDSVNSIMYTIIGQQDTVIWNWKNEKLLLTDVDSSKIIWNIMTNEKDKYVLTKNDSLYLSFSFPDGHEVTMKRTLPMATFLVRSHYDYLNGTHTVDSAIVPPRHLIKK